MDLDSGRARSAGRPGPRLGAPHGRKLLVTSRALRLRRDHPDWFARRLPAADGGGPRGRPCDRVRARRARGRSRVVTRLPGRACAAAAAGRDTTLPLPAGHRLGGRADRAVHGGRGPAGRPDAAAAGRAPRPAECSGGVQVTVFSVWAPDGRAGRRRGGGRPRHEMAPLPGRPGWWEAEVDGSARRPTTRSGSTAASRCPTRARRASRTAPPGRAGPTTTPPSRWTDAGWRGRAAARGGHLRAARRHVHPGGDAGRRHRPAGLPGGARRHGRGADAARRVPRPARLGIRRDRPVGGARAVRRARRAEAVR